MYTLGFIGCGNMGGALVRAAAKTVSGDNIAVCDYDENKAQTLARDCGVTVANITEIAQSAKFIVLGVKPQNMQTTLAPVAELLQQRKNVVLVTMAAGLSINAIRSFVGANLPIVRIMPNTPVLLGEGMILYATDGVTAQDKAEFLTAFEKAGVFDELPEGKIDGASALSGCGPAYVYAFAEALADGAVACGVPADKAALYAAQTLKGAAEMLLAFGNPAQLKSNVCSPGGTTIEGIRALENSGFNEVTASAVKAAYKRTLELKK